MKPCHKENKGIKIVHVILFWQKYIPKKKKLRGYLCCINHIFYFLYLMMLWHLGSHAGPPRASELPETVNSCEHTFHVQINQSKAHIKDASFRPRGRVGEANTPRNKLVKLKAFWVFPVFFGLLETFACSRFYLTLTHQARVSPALNHQRATYQKTWENIPLAQSPLVSN